MHNLLVIGNILQVQNHVDGEVGCSSNSERAITQICVSSWKLVRTDVTGLKLSEAGIRYDDNN